MVQAFLKIWWVESDFKAPNLPLSLRFKGSGCHYNSMSSKFCKFGRHMEFYFSPNFDVFFFKLIELRASCSMSTDFLYLLRFQRLNSTKGDGKSRISKFERSFYHSILMHLFLQNDHLYWLLMNHKNAILFRKGFQIPKFRVVWRHIYSTLNIK